MLRAEKQRELDRAFTRIESWEEFFTRWNAIDTEQEATGLLYAGADLLLPSYGDQGRPAALRKRIDFYLHWAQHTNEAVSTIAQQVIVKRWLHTASNHLTVLDLVDVQGRLLELLGTRRPCLLKPPYPRFIAAYLTPVFEAWNRFPSPTDSYGKLSLALRPHGTQLVRALCVWGLAELLARGGGDFPEKINLLEGYLASIGFDVEHAVMKVLDCGPLSEDRSAPIYEERANTQAALALLKLRYWHAWSTRKQQETRAQLAARRG